VRSQKDNTVELAIAYGKAMMTSGHRNPTQEDIQIRVEDVLELCASIPSDWLMTCFKHARAHFGNIPSPATINKAWDSLKHDYREAQSRATLPAPVSKHHHECPLCPLVATRCAQYYGQKAQFITLNAWQKERLKENPQEDERLCFLEKCSEFDISEAIRKSYSRLYDIEQKEG
jgi:hypothetical protein